MQAYVGFHCPDFEPGERLAGVASGNWGCGVYRGDAKLKTLLQLMAASEAGRHLAYFTFGDTELRDQVYHMYTFLTDKQVTVGKHFVHMLICIPHTLHYTIFMNVGRGKIHDLLVMSFDRKLTLLYQNLQARYIYLIPSYYVSLNHFNIIPTYLSFLYRNIPFKILVHIFCSTC